MVKTYTLSNKRLNEIENALAKHNINEEETKNIMNDICSIFRYDPSQKVYTPEMGKLSMQRRKQKAADLGISQYALMNMHKKPQQIST